MAIWEYNYRICCINMKKMWRYRVVASMCYHILPPKNTLLERILAISLANYEEDSFGGDCFVSQSRFDAYAPCCILLHYMKLSENRKNAWVFFLVKLFLSKFVTPLIDILKNEEL